MAIFGWTTLKQAELYTRKADMKRPADAYMESIVPERKVDNGVPLLEAVAASGTNRAKSSDISVDE